MGRASLRVDYEGQVLTLGACIVLKDRLHEKVRFPPLPSGVGRVRDSGNTCPQQLAKGRIIRTHGGVHGWTDGGPPFTGPTASPFIALFDQRSEEHTSELQSLMRHSYAASCLKKKK